MPPIVEFFIITITMLGAFFLVFLLLFLFALFLAPIEKSISKVIWSYQTPKLPPPPPKPTSFKDFSRKH